MSNQIDVARVEQYKANIMMLAQQRGSRLTGSVRTDSNIVGKRAYFERIGPTEDVEVTARHMDTPLINTPHSKRSVVMRDYIWADLVDDVDKLKMIIDPTNPYAVNAAWAAGRRRDTQIIAAINGTAETGEGGSGSQVLPTSQKIPAGGTGLTLAKLRSAKEILDAAEVDPDIMRYFLVSAKQVNDLLQINEVIDADYANIKALVNGQVDTYMGFKFIRTERLTKTGSDRDCLVYLQSGVGLALPQDISVRIDERPDKNYSMQVFMKHSVGAVRLEDVQVVEVKCAE